MWMQIDNRSIAMRLPSTMAVFVSNYGRIMAFYVYLAPHYLAPPCPDPGSTTVSVGSNESCS